MSVPDPLAIAREVSAIRSLLARQRQLLITRCAPEPRSAGTFPRSQTMRLLTREPGLATGLVAGAAAMFVANRLIRSGSLLPLLTGALRLASQIRT